MTSDKDLFLRRSEHGREVPGAVDYAGDVNSVGRWVIENHIRANNKRPQIGGKIVAPFAHLGLVGE